MIRHVSHVILSALLMVPSLAIAGAWEIDPSHSSVGFSVKHMMVTNVNGRFKKVKGTVELDDKAIEKATIAAEIDAASIDTNEDKRDGHLKSPDFFDVAKFPALTFKSKKVTTKGAGKAQIVGDLTIRGVTKEVTLDVNEISPEMKSPFGTTVRAVNATTKINRKDFGLTWNKALEAGGVLVGDDVKITLELELLKKK